MSEKKYDLTQVSEKTKDSYLKAVVEYHMNVVTNPSFVSNALDQLCREAEVKSKTAREILEEYIASSTESDARSELRQAIVAIHKALKVLP